MRIIILLCALITYIFSTQCKDGSFCPGIQTCCLTPIGVGCCPYPDANCCGDGVHCCPNGYICYTGGCYRQNNHFLTLFKEENDIPKAELLTPNIEEENSDILKCVEDLKAFLNQLKIAIENIRDIESIIRLIESLDEDARHNFANCYEKLKKNIFEYFS